MIFWKQIGNNSVNKNVIHVVSWPRFVNRLCSGDDFIESERQEKWNYIEMSLVTQVYSCQSDQLDGKQSWNHSRTMLFMMGTLKCFYCFFHSFMCDVWYD